MTESSRRKMRERLFPEPWMRWYDLPVLRRIALSRWSFMRKGWHPTHRRLARARALYWVLLRGHDSEICGRCGGPVTGYGHRHPSGESAGGCLCPACLSDLAKAAGLPFLRWACSTDDSALMIDELVMQLRIENEKHPNHNITKLLQRATQ